MVDRVLECPKARLLFGRSNGGPLLRLYGSVTDFRPWSTVVNFVPSLTFAPADVRRRLRALRNRPTQRAQVRALGAKFDEQRGLWFVPAGCSVAPFAEWLP